MPRRNLLGGLKTGAIAAKDLVSATVDRFIEAEAYRLAASLSFYAISSMFPLLLVAISVGEIVLGDSSQMRSGLIRALNATDSAAVRALIEDTLQGLRSTEEPNHWGILIGLFGAAFGASGIFLELDAAMEKLFRIPAKKTSIWQDIRHALADRGAALILVAGTSLVLLSSSLVLGAVEVIAAHIPGLSRIAPGMLTRLSAVSITVLGVALCYRVVPDTPVRLPAALAGALFAAGGFYAVRWPLTWAVTHLTSYAAYGVVGSLLLLVTWFYVASCILLFGGALTAIRNERLVAGTELPQPEKPPAPSTPLAKASGDGTPAA